MSGNKIKEVREVGGKIYVKLLGMAAGDWHIYDNRIDSLIDHVRRELEIPNLSAVRICAAAGMPHAYLSECRRGRAIPNVWFLRLHDISGVSIADLRTVACTAPLAAPFSPVKKPRKQALVSERHNPQPLRPPGHFNAS